MRSNNDSSCGIRKFQVEYYVVVHVFQTATEHRQRHRHDSTAPAYLIIAEPPPRARESESSSPSFYRYRLPYSSSPTTLHTCFGDLSAIIVVCEGFHFLCCTGRPTFSNSSQPLDPHHKASSRIANPSLLPPRPSVPSRTLLPPSLSSSLSSALSSPCP